MLELAREAAREAVMESWLHGFPASALRDGQVVDVWPTDEELKRFPCYDMIANQVKRELASQASPPTTDN
ncbi:MAG: hypothetical protein C0478_00910 [Planctomyces sp.]|nr:hypothetical protein [Planctomyces sp.]